LTSPNTVPPKKDFQHLRSSGQAPGATLSIGRTVGDMRDALAGRLVRLGVTPNGLTIIGFLLSLIGSAFLALSAGAALPIDRFAPAGAPRSWLPLIAVAWYFLSAACDMLDGAVARIGNLHSEFGAVLDSCLDRVSDTAVWCGCVVYFAGLGNVTYSFLAIVALSNAYMISYVKARAEDIIPDCTVGFWQRGERTAAVLIGAFAGHVQILLWQQALLPLLTAMRRLSYTEAYLRAQAGGLPLPQTGVPSGWRKWIMPWRHPRGSLGFDITVGFNVALLIVGPVIFPWFYCSADPLGALLRRWFHF
jgi:phosphatidylglycerophosphate synthase